jgi:hypothetical protein
MASSSKRKTTFAKLNRETKLREKRIEKAARREARKLEDATQRDESATATTATASHLDLDLADVDGVVVDDESLAV